MAENKATSPVGERLQIGWITEALVDDDDLWEFLSDRNFDCDVSALGEYTGEERIEHAHGPISRPIPVYIDWEPGHWASVTRSRS